MPHRKLAALPKETLRELVSVARRAALGELTAGVAHELNNPLFAVLGLAELSLSDVEPGSALAERLDLVRSTALEMRETIRALVAFVRAEDAGAAPDDLGDAARDAVALFRRTSAARRLELVERYPDGPVPVVVGPAELRQIVLQLLLEARSALGEAGTIAVELEPEPGGAALRVRDGAADPRPEAGLGLLVARALAEEAGGGLAEESPGVVLLRLPSP